MQSEESKGLSKLDIFGLVSGSIGLIADVISLSALFTLTSASVQVPKSSWVTTIILLIYTGLVIGFYSRRLLCYLNRGKAKEEKFTTRGYARIEQASIAITALITGTLWLMLLYSAYPSAYRMIDEAYSQGIQAINEKYEKLKANAKPEEKEKLEEARKTSIRVAFSKEAGVMLYWFVGLSLSVPLIMFLNFLSRVIYRGCDINYQAA